MTSNSSWAFDVYASSRINARMAVVRPFLIVFAISIILLI